jgi:branched-chain amino acid transport system ATP-binding protein
MSDDGRDERDEAQREPDHEDDGEDGTDEAQREPDHEDDGEDGTDDEQPVVADLSEAEAEDQPSLGPRRAEQDSPGEGDEAPPAGGDQTATEAGEQTGTDEPAPVAPEEDATGEAVDQRPDDASEDTATAGEAADELLTVRGLDAGYGDLQILSGVNLDVAEGEYVTIVGPNGAGKSTAMKSIFGLTNLMGGEIRFAGQDITDLRPEDIIHTGIGYVPQSDNVFAGLTVVENLEMGAYILDEVPQDRLDAVYDRFPILEERKGQRAGTLSGGQQQMLAMGRALMLDPDLLLLDEPSAGLAPDLVEDMFDRIDGINDSGTAILMVEQNAKEALRRCDRGYVLVQGQNRFEDSGDALLADEEVRQQFLGG